jgi:hypothetical protein
MSHVLSVSTSPDGDVVYIHADEAGLDFLIERLTRLRGHIQHDECEHEHFMTLAWGGHGLSERELDSEERQVHHVKLYGWTDEFIEHHNLKDPNAG